MSSHIVDRQRNRYSVLHCMDTTPCDSVEVGKAENIVQFGQNLYPVQWAVLAICLLVSLPPPSLSSFICFHMRSRHVSLPCCSTSPPSFLICAPFLHARSHFPTSSSLFLPSPVLLPIGSSRSLATWAYAHPV